MKSLPPQGYISFLDTIEMLSINLPSYNLNFSFVCQLHRSLRRLPNKLWFLSVQVAPGIFISPFLHISNHLAVPAPPCLPVVSHTIKTASPAESVRPAYPLKPQKSQHSFRMPLSPVSFCVDVQDSPGK